MTALPQKPNVKCPICKKIVIWETTPHRPFCSKRCKLIDLGKWADGSYSLTNEKPSCDENKIK